MANALQRYDDRRSAKRGASIQLAESAKEYVKKLESQWDQALSTVVEIMNDPEAPANVRSQNAQFIMKHTIELKAAMTEDVESVISALAQHGEFDLNSIAEKVTNDAELTRAVISLQDRGASSASGYRGGGGGKGT